jgi:predicted ATPase/signal transduction histidine kinase
MVQSVHQPVHIMRDHRTSLARNVQRRRLLSCTPWIAWRSTTLGAACEPGLAMPHSPLAYTVTDVLGHGSRTTLYRALRSTDGCPVVLKVLDPRRSHPKDVERLRHEHEIGELLTTPAVVRPLALVTYQGMPALVLEDFGGRSLDHLLGAPMPVDRFLPLAIRIASGVADVHQQDIVHKDLKPHNIFVDLDTGEVKIADLEMASQVPRERVAPQSPSRIEGSLPYLSPEQTGRMNRAVDSRSDLYSLGVTFYQLLTGRLPFEADDPLEWVHCHVARTPSSPSELVPGLPSVLSGIVLKLLAKMAEHRYQTACGLQRDLERCLAEWEARHSIEPFGLGEQDVSDRFELAQKLYGRDEEVAEVFAAFERVTAQGTPELVLVSGYSGIGKSSLVRELHRPIVRERGLFISGKFDQLNRDIPYSTFAQAFGELVEQILTESEERMAVWRQALQHALGTSGGLVVDIVPQVALIIGPQAPVPPLPPLEAQNRFHMVLRQFVGVFAREEHPLVLFLDDLQWLDSGSLALLEDIVIHPQTRHLLIIGAYRDNEVGRSHPLALMLDKLRRSDAIVHELVLAPLTAFHLTQFIADALRSTPDRAAPLAGLVHEKTAGNPFFAIQFLTALHQEGLLELDRETSQWRWDATEIEKKGFTDNVVDLVVRKLKRLPLRTQQALKLAACVGTATDIQTLAVISKQSEEETGRDLWEAVREGLMLQLGDVYAFLHDRVQQGAYVLIEDDQRKQVHLEIGRLLLASLDARKIEERIFDVVSQLDHGVELLTDQAERDELARLNIIAGRKAKASIAYVSARNFLAIAAALLPEDAWESRYDVLFPLFMERAECEYLCGAFDRAEALFELLLGRARSSFDAAMVYELRLKLYHVAGKYDEAVATATKALRLFGVEIPEDDDALAEATRAEAAEVERNLGDRTIMDLADAPEATDPGVKAVIGLLSNVAPAAYIGTRPQVFPFIALKLVNVSLVHGHTHESCVGYSAYALWLVAAAGDARRGHEFSEMSIKLNLELGDISRRGTVLHVHGTKVHFWSHPIAAGIPILERGFVACLDAGDLVFANYIAYEILWQIIERGDTIDDVLQLSQRYAAFARDSRNDAVHQTIRLEQQFLACLEGRTRGTTDFDDDSFQTAHCLARITDTTFTCGIIFYHMMKLIVAYLFGDDAMAMHHAREAKQILPAVMAMPMEATYYFFHALLLAGVLPQAAAEDRPEMLAMLTDYGRKLERWADDCPANFLAKHALVDAELARVTGDELRAERRYEQAIQAARDSGFVHWEALANELAARFNRERGFETVASAYLREAARGYDRWGAKAKVLQLEQREPALREVAAAGPAATFSARSEQLDLLSVAKAAQTISGEIVLDTLVGTLLEVVLQQGGAQRACLILCHERELSIEAEAALEPEGSVTCVLRSEPVNRSRRLPISLVHYVQRMGQRVILDDAVTDAGKFSADEYIARARPLSVLCMPILRQAKVVGLLYLENNLLVDAFTPERLVALELLATQAAISLQNAQLLANERAARAAAEQAERRAAFLAEAAAILSESLDHETTFERLGRLCVRSLASTCVLDLVEDQAIRRAVVADRDPAREPLLRELKQRNPSGQDSPHPAAMVLRTGKPLLLPELPDELARSMCTDDEHRRLIRELGTESVIAVPLVARGQTLGVLTLISSEPGRRYGQADLELAEELARRAASAIDNARLYRASQEAVRARSEFLTVASHELNTPVTSLMLALQSLRQAAPSGRPLAPHVLDKLLDLAARQGSRLAKLVGDLLDVSRLEAGRLPLELAEVDLGALVREVVARLEPDLARARCPVSITDDAAVVGWWDRSRIDRIVTNLLSNAIKFGTGAPIELTLGSEHGIARLTVRDHGIGIEPEQCGRIFGRFERGVSERHYGGLGLGLYISRRVAEDHGGMIRCDSQPGAGATFTLELPCARSPWDAGAS